MVRPMTTQSMKKMEAGKETDLAESFPAKKALFDARKRSRGKKGGFSRGHDLPLEIIIEILSWLSVKTLLQCKLVCKQWYHLIQDRYFVEKHMKRAELHSEYIDKTEEDQRPFRGLICIDGLLLEQKNVSGNLRVRNPAMCRFIDLPPTKNKSLDATICYAKSSGYYKVASLNNLNELEILTLGQNEHPSWRSIDAPIFDAHSRAIKSIAIEGVVHYFRTIREGEKVYTIKSLDTDSEIITTSILPGNTFNNDTRVFIMRNRVNIALAEIVNEELHFITLIDYKESKWAKKKKVIPLKFLKENPEKRKFPEHCGVNSGSVLFWQRSYNFYAYKPKTKNFKVSPAWEGKVISFHGPKTLVSFKGMTPETSHVTGNERPNGLP